jgi:hypothetical protein
VTPPEPVSAVPVLEVAPVVSVAAAVGVELEPDRER